MLDYFRIACAVPNVEVADVDFNASQIKKFIAQAKSENADLLVFPELCVTGYTCADLFFQKPLLDAALRAVAVLARESAGSNMLVAIGAPIALSGALYNCAVIVFGGKVVGIVPKTFIPNYGEFYEKRWFRSASDLKQASISSSEIGIEGGYEIPVGSMIFNQGGVKVGFEICEDLWAPLPPSTQLCLAGAEVIANLSASNETIAKRSYRRELVNKQSASGICAYAFCSAGNTESTTDLIFSGHSLIAENGAVSAEQEKLVSSDYIIFADVDAAKLRRDRMHKTSFGDCSQLYGLSAMPRMIDLTGEQSKACGKYAKVNKLPFVPNDERDRLERCLAIFEMQVAGLKKRLEKTGCRPVIGVSGGLDSTLALLVSVQTVRELGRPLSDVIGITMPCFGTTDRTYNNAVCLMKSLGITSLEINIKQACLRHFEDIGQSADSYDLTYENAQARERTQVLMDYAGKSGGIVIGTGDLSELALGWCTYNGDHMSMYGVNASIPKTLIRWMIDCLIKHDIFENSTEYLKDIIATPISPELLPPGAEGEIAQQTETIVGPYALHDFFLYYVLRFGFAPDKVFALAQKAFAADFDSATILKWLKTFYKRFFSQQFKRSCMPDGVKVGSVCLSPRGDWRMPSDSSANLWLKMLDDIG